ncbi:uncharacterized protein L969DRAFT_617138 [Mixia osmundae IAM 14324]|uniref:Ketoreductase domain-containing protein n=1 Tax=Mixia osmundae (strain CBS 9802 / IAM 14324 / JCM 22182 / KY 12970) TaxID=764103 RepID=G7E5T1_MIXOS|nr:uncharacterized protein L969DRAFT_617138 [Mixia osmundae IAM 14324]KEI40658.1 hypothetical protein L969DRAFT_617138 [Mixia osmundae IAM 14324]GAA98191.1 hypothetical protein E5Q_04874 [Mixia osmundae IAM 14324]
MLFAVRASIYEHAKRLQCTPTYGERPAPICQLTEEHVVGPAAVDLVGKALGDLDMVSVAAASPAIKNAVFTCCRAEWQMRFTCSLPLTAILLARPKTYLTCGDTEQSYDRIPGTDLRCIDLFPIPEYASSRSFSNSTRASMVFNVSRLEGKNVLVTGASAGIGRETARLFAKAGANVILASRRKPVLEELKALIEKESSGVKVEAVELDMTSKASVGSLLDRVKLRPLDILINNAGGVLGTEKVGEIKQEDIEWMISTNVTGLIQLTQAVVLEFKKNNSGHVINIGSVAGREPYAGGSIYCASKHAVRAFTGSLLRELVETPIRVSEIQPGLVETNFSVHRFRGDKAKADAIYADLDPLTPEDIAEEIVWVAARPPHVNIAELFVMPVSQASAGIKYAGGKRFAKP